MTVGARCRRSVQGLERADRAISGRLALPERQPQAAAPLFWLATVGAHLGDSLLWLGLTAWLWRRAGDDGSRKQDLLGWTASVVLALLIALVSKSLFKRRRPASGRFLYGRGADVHSFPSGHAARGGVLLLWAGVLHPLLGRWAPLLVLWTGWARVALGVHYLGDVLGGGLVGLARSLV